MDGDEAVPHAYEIVGLCYDRDDDAPSGVESITVRVVEEEKWSQM